MPGCTINSANVNCGQVSDGSTIYIDWKLLELREWWGEQWHGSSIYHLYLMWDALYILPLADLPC